MHCTTYGKIIMIGCIPASPPLPNLAQYNNPLLRWGWIKRMACSGYDGYGYDQVPSPGVEEPSTYHMRERKFRQVRELGE